MKNIILLTALIFTSYIVRAEVINPSEEMMKQDLSFGHSESSESSDKRKVASDNKEELDGERDVASEADQSSNKVQFWDY